MIEAEESAKVQQLREIHPHLSEMDLSRAVRMGADLTASAASED
jgi:hypothetical protein